jgi:hypothetical protein
MTKSSDTEEGSKTSIQVASDADLELKEIEELDANGRPIMVESGEYIDKLINDNGTPRFIQEPVMVPKMVPLAKGEVDKLRLQRNQSLNELEKVAVNQV